jgi:putative aldouronate transport system permease protein
MRYRITPAGIITNIILYTLLVTAAVSCILPIINILAISFSDPGPAMAGQVGLWPKGLSLSAYNFIATNGAFWRAAGVTVKRLVLGVIVNTVLTVMCAYPLSKTARRFPQRKYYIAFFLWAMLFSGGLIPTYLTVYRTGIMNTIWALILPGAVPLGNVILMMNFFRNLPDEIEEAAIIDGAGHWTVMLRIYVPLSTASMATVTLFTILGHWNAWFDGVIYTGDTFLQRYFTKGLVVGSVKG